MVLTHLGNQAAVEWFSKSVRGAEAKKQTKPGPRLPTASLFAFLGSKVSSCFKFMNDVNALEATDSLYAGMLQKDSNCVSLRTYSNCLLSVPGHVKVRRRSGSTSVAEDEHGKNFAPVQGLSNWFTLPRTQDTTIKPLFFSCMFLLPSPTLTHYKEFNEIHRQGLATNSRRFSQKTVRHNTL